jgi:5-methylcytosine-specific restriction endonuclease McrA
MDTPIVPEKRCTKCCNLYPATTEYFHKHSGRKDGMRNECKTCHIDEQRRYRASHVDEDRERCRNYYAKHKDSARLYRQQYYAENKVAIYARKQEYRAQHREKDREYSRRYRTENPEKRREIVRRSQRKYPEKHATRQRVRRARKQGAEGTFTFADEQAQFKRQKGKCYYCGCKMTRLNNQLNSATVDHVFPIIRNGRNSPDNLVIACKSCNSKKGTRLPHEWAEGGRLL